MTALAKSEIEALRWLYIMRALWGEIVGKIPMNGEEADAADYENLIELGYCREVITPSETVAEAEKKAKDGILIELLMSLGKAAGMFESGKSIKQYFITEAGIEAWRELKIETWVD